MLIEVLIDDQIVWHIGRKSYRKARWKRKAQRSINDALKFLESYPNSEMLIFIRR